MKANYFFTSFYIEKMKKEPKIIVLSEDILNIKSNKYFQVFIFREFYHWKVTLIWSQIYSKESMTCVSNQFKFKDVENKIIGNKIGLSYYFLLILLNIVCRGKPNFWFSKSYLNIWMLFSNLVTFSGLIQNGMPIFRNT